jgi:hypothetical protein
MEIKKEKKLHTINDCKNFDDIKKAIKDIIGQYNIMQARINYYEVTHKSMIQAIEWFLNPIKSEGRKDD